MNMKRIHRRDNLLVVQNKIILQNMNCPWKRCEKDSDILKIVRFVMILSRKIRCQNKNRPIIWLASNSNDKNYHFQDLDKKEKDPVIIRGSSPESVG